MTSNSVTEPGRVYRTADFNQRTANAPRFVRRLVESGALQPLCRGLFLAPARSRFGTVPANDQELMRTFLKGTPFVFTGPEHWNALGLGTTAMFAEQLVYNTKRSGTFELNGRRFLLRRVRFPERPPLEWFVVDLFENAASVGVSPAELAEALGHAVRRGRFDQAELSRMAGQYGTVATQKAIMDAFLR
jgi:hypothetical protein